MARPATPAEIAARLTPPMRDLLAQYASRGFGDGASRVTTYAALYARGLLDRKVEDGWWTGRRGEKCYGPVTRRIWITELGRAVAAVLPDDA